MKFTILALVLLLTACSSDKIENHYTIKVGQNETSYLKDINACPKVHIKRTDSALIQKEGNKKAFEIIAYKYSGYCYHDETTGKYKTRIKPEFKVIRLANVDVTDIQFSYYLETAEGPSAFLGKKSYFANVILPVGASEITYVADEVELSIPQDKNSDADVYFGLNEDISDLQFRK